MLFLKINRIMFYSIGINHYNINKKNNTIHAEVDCINNLKYSCKKKNINLFVFRTNPKGTELLKSKPCDNCINFIKNNLQKKNYKLNNLYFIDNVNEINIIKNLN